jgi:hypothetical protein
MGSKGGRIYDVSKDTQSGESPALDNTTKELYINPQEMKEPKPHGTESYTVSKLVKQSDIVMRSGSVWRVKLLHSATHKAG